MSSNDNSSTSFTPIPSSSESQEVAANLRSIFQDWRPTMPSSWVTPPECEDCHSPTDSEASSTLSTCLRRDLYVPQLLICTDDNLCLHAAHTPYSAPSTLVNEEAHSSTNSFPCPTPEPITNTSTSPDLIPILPRTEDPSALG